MFPKSKIAAIVFTFATLTAGLSSHAQQAVAPLSSSSIEAAKSAAAAIAQSGGPKNFVLDSQGQIARNPDGTPVTSGPSGRTTESQMQMMQSITGMQAPQSLTSFNSSGQIGAIFKSSTYLDFSCGDPVGKQATSLGLTATFAGCAQSGGAPTAMSFKICDRTRYGAPCDKPEYFVDVTAPVGAYSPSISLSGQSSLAAGAGCNNSTGVCRVTFQFSETVQGNLTQPSATGAAAPISTIQDSISNTLDRRIINNEFVASFNQQSAEYKACMQKLSNSASTGKAITCDGTRELDIGSVTKADGAPINPTCDKTPVCKSSSVQSEKFQTYCVRSAPLTTKACQSTIPSLTCTETNPGGSSCTTEQLVGGAQVGATDFKCIESVEQPVLDATGKPVLDATGTAVTKTVCVKQERTVYYIFPDKASDVSCAGTPHPLLQPEQCASSSATAERLCPTDAIFGRTLSEADCSVQTSVLEPVFYQEKAGCGACLKPTLGYTCLAQPTAAEPADTCQLPADAQCSLESVVPYTGQNGLVDAQKEVYNCVRQASVCTEYAPPAAGCGNLIDTFGLNKPQASRPDYGAFAKAMAGYSAVSGVAQSGEKDSLANPLIPQIFGGKDSRCRKPAGFLSGLLANNCCRTNLERPGGSRPLHKCTLDEVRLAAARRAKNTVFVGEYCSAKKRFIGCIERTETYCAFDDMLPRIIHEQGRAQLASIVSNTAGVSAEKKPLAYNFYQSNGGWLGGFDTNGVTIKPWVQPSYCADIEASVAYLTANPGATECIAKTDAYFAICDKAGSCGTLPADPYDRPDDSRWIITPVDAISYRKTNITPFISVTGACNTATGACSYEVDSLPPGQNGRAFLSVTSPVSIYVSDSTSGSTTGSFSAEQTMLLGDSVLRPLSIIGPITSKLPPTFGFFFSDNNGATYQQYSAPMDAAGMFKVSLPNGYVLDGSCDALGNVCNVKMAGEVVVQAKPFGSPTGPDCSGFTIAQFSALDFSKMDLNEWITKITTQALSSIQRTTATDSFVKAVVDSSLGAQQGATFIAVSPVRADTARIYPRQEYGPFTAKIAVSGNYPAVYLDDARNNDAVTRVQVDWGDCTLPDELTPVYPDNAVSTKVFPSFQGTHVFASPDAIPASCGGGENNINHTVKVTIFSASGVHTTSLRVINVFKDFPNSIGYDEGEAGKTVDQTSNYTVPSTTNPSLANPANVYNK